MATAIRQQQTTQKIFAAVKLLESDEAEQPVRRALQLQARRRTPTLSARETELLEEIYINYAPRS